MESSEARCGNDEEISDDFDDDGNCCDSVDFDSADYCCSPKSLAAIDLAFVADDASSSTDCPTLCSDRFLGFHLGNCWSVD